MRNKGRFTVTNTHVYSDSISIVGFHLRVDTHNLCKLYALFLPFLNNLVLQWYFIIHFELTICQYFVDLTKWQMVSFTLGFFSVIGENLTLKESAMTTACRTSSCFKSSRFFGAIAVIYYLINPKINTTGTCCENVLN